MIDPCRARQLTFADISGELRLANSLSVSNSLSGRHWELDQVPAVGDPTDIVQLGSGATQRCLNLGFSERIGNSRRTGSCRWASCGPGTIRATTPSRGMEFLFSLNRLSVATSRARCAVFIVASHRLLGSECRTPHQMRLANGLCRFVELARETT